MLRELGLKKPTENATTLPLPWMAGVKQRTSGTLSHFHRAYFDDVHLWEDEQYNCLLRYILYTKHITSRTAAKISLPTTTSKSVFEEVSKNSTGQLCFSSSSPLDGGYTDAEVGELIVSI